MIICCIRIDVQLGPIVIVTFDGDVTAADLINLRDVVGCMRRYFGLGNSTRGRRQGWALDSLFLSLSLAASEHAHVCPSPSAIGVHTRRYKLPTSLSIYFLSSSSSSSSPSHHHHFPLFQLFLETFVILSRSKKRCSSSAGSICGMIRNFLFILSFYFSCHLAKRKNVLN